MSTKTESELLAAVVESPDNSQARLVYADWLEERGDIRAKYLRLEVEFAATEKSDDRYQPLSEELHALRREVDRNWRLLVTQSKIVSCDVPDARDGLFDYECPRSWDRLQTTEDQSVRFCDGCKQHVFLCNTIAEAEFIGARGVCVAIDVCAKPKPKQVGPQDPDTLQLRRMGRVAAPRLPKGFSEKLEMYPSRRIIVRSKDRKEKK